MIAFIFRAAVVVFALTALSMFEDTMVTFDVQKINKTTMQIIRYPRLLNRQIHLNMVTKQVDLSIT